MALLGALAVLATVAVSAHGAGPQGNEAPPFQNASLARGSGPNVLVFTATVPAGVDANIIAIELSQPADVVSVQGGSCQIVRNEGRSTVFCEGPFPAGTTITVTMQTAVPYPTNGGASVSGGTTDGRLMPPVDAPGPQRPRGRDTTSRYSPSAFTAAGGFCSRSTRIAPARTDSRS